MLTKATVQDGWCVAEYSTPIGRLFVTATKLSQALLLIEPSKNPAWQQMVQDDTPITVRIIMVGTREQCYVEANRQEPAWCNLAAQGSKRPLIQCSNGETYRTQQEAANALGLDQGAISAQLNGRLRTVKGYTFTYINS